MANLIKYGRYWIAAGIAVGGALWFNRPKDPRIQGEDYAATFEAIQDLYVAYLTGDENPDWYTWNNNSTNSIYIYAQYSVIETMANRLRLHFQKSDSMIFWTNDEVTNQMEMALSRGSYYATNALGTLVDKLGTPVYTTNHVLRYSTNTFADVIATTASRLATTNSQFEYRIASGYATELTKTNIPLANLIFDRGAGNDIVSTGLVNGSKWPFTRSYSFPWEQWSDIDRSRVTVTTSQKNNCVYDIAEWIATNDLELSFALTATNGAGYAVSRFQDVNGNTSLPFVTIAPPANNNGLYLDVYTKELGYFESYALIIRKGANATGQEVIAQTVYGYPQSTTVRNQGATTSIKDFQIQVYTNVYSVIKFSTSSTNVQPIYFCIAYTNAPVLTNAYFSIDAFDFTSTAMGDATLSAMAAGQEIRDDRRITTNQLNQFRQVITNMNRTVYFGGETTLDWTNKYQIVKTSTNYNYYWDESLSGTGDWTPLYNDGYMIGDYLVDYRDSVADTVTNSAGSMAPGMIISSLVFSFDANAQGNVYPDGDWDTRTFVVGTDNTRKQYGYYGCTPVYPSIWAITNGYINKVSIYAVYEPSAINPRTYPMPEDDTYSHTVSGEHYYSKNLGLSMESNTISTATDDIDTTITKLNYQTFNDSGNILDFNNRAVFNLVYEIDSPTNKIVFDFIPKEVINCNCEKFRYFFYQTGASNTNRTEVWYQDYSVNYEVRAPVWMVVVDWKFQHLGRGFEPQTNSPSWR